MEPLFTPEQLAAALGLSVQTLYNRRTRGESLPPCIKLGRQLRFFLADVQNWLEAQRDGSGVHLADHLREPGHAHQADPPRRRGRPTNSDEIRRRSPLLA
ncbi:helix-turn-helix domain-containing protein [Achromobacter sp. 77]|nr:helix-turn-helix domain-containing protein [Achromobacter sp. 77]UDG76483.1 helix-turn-helix domain-containing protein [Achromobacter sp. 77]